MSRVALISILATVFLLWSCQADLGSERQDEVTLVIAGASTGQELDLTVAGLRRFMDESPGVRVHVRPTPNTYEGRLGLYKRLLSSGSDEVDVYQIDVVWTRAMAEHALDLSDYVSQSELQKHFASIVENNTIDGKLVGVPWFSDAPVLYYRSDLLAKYGFESPPATWQELEEMAQKIQVGERQAGNLGFWGYVWQGRGYEGLTCNALEWQSSQGGGNFIDKEGKPSLNTPEMKTALRRAARWVGSISPPNVVRFDEEDARYLWEQGDAAFMRNWSYAYSLSKDSAIADKFAVTKMPQGVGGTAAVLGGWQLMVSRYSRNPEAAARLVRFLCGREEQKRRAISGSENPTIRALYQDEEILAAVPFFQDFERTLLYAVRRPSSIVGDKYDSVSEAYWTSVRNVLTGADLETELKAGEQRISEALGD